MRTRSWTDEQFSEAVQASTSVREALARIGLVAAGGNYKEFRKHVRRLGLGTSHFIGKAHRKGRGAPKQDLREILVADSSYTNSNALRLRLIREGVFEAKCSECELVEWRGRPITLHLEHVNGRSNDNRVENLRLLCPNCHSQTSTYCGRNKKRN
jgi:Zn finger protein HypA/HybF involved in hydrogenase expression